jgi:hypothetical protein
MKSDGGVNRFVLKIMRNLDRSKGSVPLGTNIHQANASRKRSTDDLFIIIPKGRKLSMGMGVKIFEHNAKYVNFANTVN